MFLVTPSTFLLVGLVGFMSSRNNVVEMSSRVPEGMSDWLDSPVLMCVSVVDAEFCIELRKRHRICGNSAREGDYELVAPDSDERVCFPTFIKGERPFFYAYEYFFSQLNVTFPFTAFETDLLWSCNIAPSQLHPNSWGFIKIFQLLCRELDVTPSHTLFLYLFVSAKPGGSSKKKASWVSFRSAQGHKVFAMYDESFKDFKNYFFRVCAVEGARPFFLDENDEPSFPLEWQQDVRVSWFTWEMLDEVERAFVVVLEELWGEPPHLDTKRFLNDPSLVRTVLGTCLSCLLYLFLNFFFPLL